MLRSSLQNQQQEKQEELARLKEQASVIEEADQAREKLRLLDVQLVELRSAISKSEETEVR